VFLKYTANTDMGHECEGRAGRGRRTQYRPLYRALYFIHLSTLGLPIIFFFRAGQSRAGVIDFCDVPVKQQYCLFARGDGGQAELAAWAMCGITAAACDGNVCQQSPICQQYIYACLNSSRDIST
jgi:hypothetical protein